MGVEGVESVADRLDQVALRSQGVDRADAAVGETANATGGLVVDISGGEHPCVAPGACDSGTAHAVRSRPPRPPFVRGGVLRLPPFVMCEFIEIVKCARLKKWGTEGVTRPTTSGRAQANRGAIQAGARGRLSSHRSPFTGGVSPSWRKAGAWRYGARPEPRRGAMHKPGATPRGPRPPRVSLSRALKARDASRGATPPEAYCAPSGALPRAIASRPFGAPRAGADRTTSAAHPFGARTQ
jgi:hypothetical protein